MMMVVVPVSVPMADAQASMTSVWTGDSSVWPMTSLTPMYNTYPVEYQDCFQSQMQQGRFDTQYDTQLMSQQSYAGSSASYQGQAFQSGRRGKMPTLANRFKSQSDGVQQRNSKQNRGIQNRSGQATPPKTTNFTASRDKVTRAPSSASHSTGSPDSSPKSVSPASSDTEVEEVVREPPSPKFDPKKVEEAIKRSFELIQRKDEVEIEAQCEKVYASDAVMSWPDMQKELRGRSQVTQYMLDTVRNVPDMELSLQKVDQHEGSARYVYTISGTAVRDHLLFPAGRRMCWQFTVLTKCDDFGMVTRRQAIVNLSERSSLSKEPSIFNCFSANALALSRTSSGSRILQQVIEQADGSVRAEVAEQFAQHVWEVSASPHGNHVLQKCIVCMPPARVQFIVEELQGRIVVASQHRTRCRILERLMEHFPAELTASLVDEVASSTAMLCKHAFGNFAVQSILEHGVPEARARLAAIILADVHRLAKHKIASNVVRCALAHSPRDSVAQLVHALSADPREFANLAHHRIGSFVVREVKLARSQ